MTGGVDGTPSPYGGMVTPLGFLGVTNMNGFASSDIFPDGTAFAAITAISFAPVLGNGCTQTSYCPRTSAEGSPFQSDENWELRFEHW